MFSADQYKVIIESVLENGLVSSTDWMQNSSTSVYFLRHDIDFCVDSARDTAELEKNIGVSSTYFFMMSSNMYNVFSKRNQCLISEIKEMGHKISLHFDPTAYNTLDAFHLEKNSFESLFGVNVDIVSIHRPGPFSDNNNISLFGVRHTYQDKFFKQMKYISDSGGVDPSNSVKDYLSDKEGKGLQLLLHPIWWQSKSKGATETLNEWTNKHNNLIKSEVRSNCKTYLD